MTLDGSVARPGGVPVSRREALRRLLFAGGGVLAAASLGCAPRPGSAPRPPAPGPATVEAPPPPLEPTPPPPPAPLATATATAAATPAATPPPAARDLRLDLLPSSLAIPAIGLATPVQPAATVRGPDGRPEIVVPDTGVVSPNRALGRNSVNNAWVLGHSQWRGVPQLLYPLAGVQVGDQVWLDAFELARSRELTHLEYRVTRYILTDRIAGFSVVYGLRSKPRVVIQTSVRETGARDWILDRPLIESKCEVVLDGSPDDPRKYLLLLVVAELADHDLARAASVIAGPERA